MTDTTKWTDKSVLKIRPPEGAGADCKAKHPTIGGLAIRFQNGGTGTFTFYYTVAGKPKTFKIAKVGDMTVDAVEQKAHELRGMLAGPTPIDPHAARAKAATKASQTLSTMIEPFTKYLRKLGRTEKYIGDVKRNFGRLDALLPIAIGEIDRGMVASALNALEDEFGERTTGICRAQLSSLYSYAMMEEGYLGANPVDGTRNRPSKASKRVLTEKEIALVWRATEAPTDFNTIVRLLLLTACRLNMIASLPRAEVRLDENKIEVAAERMKGGEIFEVALSRQAKVILGNVLNRRIGSPFVFGSGGKGGFSGQGMAMIRLRERMVELNGGEEIPHWTLHDFRRTFVTLGSDVCGIDERDADLCLSHFGGGVRAGSKKHYNHAKFIGVKLKAMQTWADYVERLVHGKREFKVV